MNGKAVFVHAVKRMPEALMEALEANQLKIEDIDLFVFHQANLRINEMVAKQMGIPEEKGVQHDRSLWQHDRRDDSDWARRSRQGRQAQAGHAGGLRGIWQRVYLGLGADSLVIQAGKGK